MPSNFREAFLSELQNDLQQLSVREQLRSLVEIRGVNLCSNDYLGLAEHPALRAAVIEAVRTSPTLGGTGSRLLSGHFAAWDELEHEFANFTGAEAALYFGSGYAANVGLLTSIAGKDDIIFSDALNHASLIDGIRLSGARKEIYPHLDLDALELALQRHDHERGRKFIVTETVFSMDGDVAPVRELLALADRFGSGLIVDEAHALAVHGPSGRGIAALSRAQAGLAAAVYPCGKALASAGAFICGSVVLKDYLINHARTFIFTTAQPPYMARQLQAALRLAQGMDTERTALLAKARDFAAALRAQGWNTAGGSTQIVPLIMGENNQVLAASEALRHEGFAVRAIRPPTVPEGSARLRFSLTSAVQERDLRRLQDILLGQRSQMQQRAMAGA